MTKFLRVMAAAAAMASLSSAAQAADDTASATVGLVVQPASYCSGLSLATQLNMSTVVNADNSVTPKTFTLTSGPVTCTVANAFVSLTSTNQGLSNAGPGISDAAFDGFVNKMHYVAVANWASGGTGVGVSLNTAAASFAKSGGSAGPATGGFTLTVTPSDPGTGIKLKGGAAYTDTLTVKVGPAA